MDKGLRFRMEGGDCDDNDQDGIAVDAFDNATINGNSVANVQGDGVFLSGTSLGNAMVSGNRIDTTTIGNGILAMAFLNVEARYVFTDIDREQTHFNPEKGAVTLEEEADFKNWQIRAGLEYSF